MLLLGAAASGFLLSPAPVAGAPSADPRPSAGGLVALVADGDTLRLRDGRVVRLLQIDAPERAGGCYGRQATALLRRLAPPGARVRLERDAGLDARDAYGRLLRYVRVNGRNLNIELVRRGAARPYFFRGRRGRYAGVLLRAARQARQGRRGLWAACGPGRAGTGRAPSGGP